MDETYKRTSPGVCVCVTMESALDVQRALLGRRRYFESDIVNLHYCVLDGVVAGGGASSSALTVLDCELVLRVWVAY